REQAQAEARRLLTAIRYEGNEYIFALDFNHLMMVHPTKPERVGQSLFDEKDPAGKFYIREFVSTAKAGGGHVTHGFQPPQSKEFRDKISYVAAFQPWNWVLASGVLIDDVEAMHAKMVRSVLTSLGAISLVLLIAAFFVTRSIVGPLGRLTGSLERLAG